MMKKFFLILGLFALFPVSYQASLTNRVALSAQETADASSQEAVVNTSFQEEQETAKNISRSARLRFAGRVIGIVVLVIVALAIATIAFIGGTLGFVSLAFSMGWVTK